MFEEVLDTFENEDIKEFAIELIKTIPDYFWIAPASSTGKYHPSYALGRGGLYRHTLAVCKILNYMLSLEYNQKIFDSRQRDLLRVAGIMHDTRKSGSQKEYEANKLTKFNHPLLAAEVVENAGISYLNGKHLTQYEVDFIGDVIASHMGQFNKDKYSDMILPKPQTKGEFILHVADYLASRKDIEIKFKKHGIIDKIKDLIKI